MKRSPSNANGQGRAEAGARAMPSLKQRQLEFVRRHGYSLKAYLLALALFPPAAIFIALKIESWALPLRFAAAAMVVAIHGGIALGALDLLAVIISSD